MSDVFLMAAVISGGVALGGYAWSSTLRLRSRRARVRDMDESQTGAIPRWDHIQGAGAAVDAPEARSIAETDASLSFSGVGRQVRREGWRRALPGLLAAGGMLALLVSGALALLTSLPGKLFGIAALGVALCIAAGELSAFRRALRD